MQLQLKKEGMTQTNYNLYTIFFLGMEKVTLTKSVGLTAPPEVGTPHVTAVPGKASDTDG